MEPQPKLLAFDLDGTLAESKQQLSPDMGELLSQLLQKMPVAVMSGASWDQFQQQFLAALPSDTPFEKLYLFPTDAARCMTYSQGSWHTRYDEHFTPQERERILATLHEAIEQEHLSKPPRLWGQTVEDRGGQISFSALGQEAPVEEKKRWHDAHDDQRQRLRQALADQLPDFSVSMGGLTTIDITKKGINKSYGIEQLSEMTNIPVPQMLYVGDALGEGGNDAVVKETGVPTYGVFGPEDSEELIRSIIKG